MREGIEVAAHVGGSDVGRVRCGGASRARWSLLAACVAVLAACTGTPQTPTPTPTPEEPTEPAPAGVQVAVVLARPEGSLAPPVLEVTPRLAALAEERVGDVADIRPVTVDDPGFLTDTAAYLADGGADLVCVLGVTGAREVFRLAERFPATRFCALGTPPADTSPNVDILEVAHEELGHLLGVAVAELAGDDAVGLVGGAEGGGRSRRHAGAQAALAGTTVTFDETVGAADEARDLLEAAAEEGDLPAVVLVDPTSPQVATEVAEVVDAWVGPVGLDTDQPPTLGWAFRVEVIVDAALDRLFTNEVAGGLRPLGAADDLFEFVAADRAPPGVLEVVNAASEELARGGRDPLRSSSGTGRDPVSAPLR